MGGRGGIPPLGRVGGGLVRAHAALSFKQISVNGKSACKALFRLCARRGQQKPTINGNLLKKDSAANRLATVMANTPHGRGRGEILPLGRVGRGAGYSPYLSFILLLFVGLGLLACAHVQAPAHALDRCCAMKSRSGTTVPLFCNEAFRRCPLILAAML